MNRSTSSSREAALLGQPPGEPRPALVVDLGRVALEQTDLRPTRLDRLDRRRLSGAAGVDPPVPVVGAVRLGGGGDEPRRIPRLEHRGAGPVAVEEDHRIVRVGQPVHQVDADHQHRADRRIGRDPAGGGGEAGRKGGAGAVDVEGAGVRRPQLVLEDHRGGRGDEVGRIGAEDDQIHLLRRATRPLQRLPRRGQGEIRGRPTVRRVPAAPDAGRRLHLVDEVVQVGEALAERVVRDLVLRQIPAGGDEAGETRFGLGHGSQVPGTMPPSTESTVPWTNEAASEASQR